MSTKAICDVADLVPNSGVCASFDFNGEEKQVALFYLPDTEQKIYALDNWDPYANANVISRGIVGSIGDELVVASPMYKQHFSLVSGQCLEEEVSITIYPVALEEGKVVVAA